jgi:DNA-binding transcriptional MerR regulator
MNRMEPTGSSTDTARMRSGTAARLAGLPVATLRVWERRYGVVEAPKTEHGQRLYSNHDVIRLRLIRQLTHAGHAIGTLAGLSLEALQALIAGVPSAFALAPAPIREAIVVGRSLAHQLEAIAGWRIQQVHDDLDLAVEAPPRSDDLDLLLIRLASMQPTHVERIHTLGLRSKARKTVVVYAFGQEAVAQALTDAGVTVRREPLSRRELAQLLREPMSMPALVDAAWHVAPRRFSEERLLALTDLPSPIACECMRHMAELITQLGDFEHYSQDCVSTGPADAALHLHLSRMAGAARTLFEQALDRVVVAEGLCASTTPSDAR